MRALRTIIIVLIVSIGFLGGYFVGWYLHGENTVRLSPSEQTSAKEAGKLQQKIIEELQTKYYKPVNVSKLSTAGVNGMLKSLKDPYTVYLTPQEVQDFAEKERGSYSGIGASLQKTKDGLVISAVFEGSPAKAAGLGPGDIIVTVDGKDTKNTSIETSISRIKGAEGSTVTLSVQPKDKKQPVKTYKLVRQTIEYPETSDRIINDKGTKVGYISLWEFGGLAGRDVRKNVEELSKKGAQWFILDLRYNGGGLLGQAVTVTNVFQQGLVTSTAGLHSPKEVFTATGPVATRKPMVVLVNGFSASASEITTGALKDHDRAEIIGTTTFGKGLVQTPIELGNGAILKLTTAVYLTPDGTDINKKGITPDIVVKDDPKTRKTDEQLQAALRYISRQQAKK
jgi:carboxyl-terminal processing protease